MTPVYKLSASSITGRTNYGSMLAGNPAFELPGDFESIATVTVGSGGAATVEFTSIPATYAHLQVRIMARTTQTGDSDFIVARFNSDSGSNYNEHALYGTGSSVGAMYNTGTGCFWQRIATDQQSANTFGVMVVDILDYANTNKYTTTRHLGAFDNNGSGQIYLESNLWRDTAAITSITMLSSVGGKVFKEYSSFALYGIKSA